MHFRWCLLGNKVSVYTGTINRITEWGYLDYVYSGTGFNISLGLLGKDPSRRSNINSCTNMGSKTS